VWADARGAEVREAFAHSGYRLEKGLLSRAEVQELLDTFIGLQAAGPRSRDALSLRRRLAETC